MSKWFKKVGESLSMMEAIEEVKQLRENCSDIIAAMMIDDLDTVFNMLQNLGENAGSISARIDEADWKQRRLSGPEQKFTPKHEDEIFKD